MSTEALAAAGTRALLGLGHLTQDAHEDEAASELHGDEHAGEGAR